MPVKLARKPFRPGALRPSRPLGRSSRLNRRDASPRVARVARARDTSTEALPLPLVPSPSTTAPDSTKISDPEAPVLRPFFGYYGGKWRDALKHYPEPLYDTIVEPFAGSAGYALRYASHKIILCEIDPVLAEVWRYLIRVTPADIRAIPDVPIDGTVDDLKIPQEAKWLVGLWLNRGIAQPRVSPSKWMRDGIRPGSFWGKGLDFNNLAT
jgi:hypothetical protein